MRVKTAIDKTQWFLLVGVGIINERDYYGYPVIAVAFAWLIFRAKIEIGVKKPKWRVNNG
jgi:hypothetical protein